MLTTQSALRIILQLVKFVGQTVLKLLEIWEHFALNQILTEEVRDIHSEIKKCAKKKIFKVVKYGDY